MVLQFVATVLFLTYDSDKSGLEIRTNLSNKQGRPDVHKNINSDHFSCLAVCNVNQFFFLLLIIY